MTSDTYELDKWRRKEINSQRRRSQSTGTKSTKVVEWTKTERRKTVEQVAAYSKRLDLRKRAVKRQNRNYACKCA
ncbi:hypothetical protein L596_004228 [Steinernema carpocapsae]|uniref:Uncharacterized protein n=1 Tax=Steinernema carpocapsae TaxID=34508 RepID=A0A4U8UW58_STECR|nr:hypothetical protein L596_004228 [Steinernema carpocapsae]